MRLPYGSTHTSPSHQNRYSSLQPQPLGDATVYGKVALCALLPVRLAPPSADRHPHRMRLHPQTALYVCWLASESYEIVVVHLRREIERAYEREQRARVSSEHQPSAPASLNHDHDLSQCRRGVVAAAAVVLVRAHNCIILINIVCICVCMCSVPQPERI